MGARGFVNDRVIGDSIVQTGTQLTVKGNRKKLNLKPEPNRIRVSTGAGPSNTYPLNL